MKKLLTYLLISIQFSSCTFKNDGFNIIGHIEGIEDSTLITLYDYKQQVNLDSSFSMDGNFILKGKVEQPTACWILCKGEYVSIQVENVEMSFKSTFKNMPLYSKIKGGEEQELYNKLKKLQHPFDKLYFEANDSLREKLYMTDDEKQKLLKKRDESYKTLNEICLNFGIKHFNTHFGLEIVFRNRENIPKDSLIKIYEDLPSTLKKTTSARALNSFLIEATVKDVISTDNQDSKGLPSEFINNAYTHIEKLCEFGIRENNNSSACLTMQYLKDQFEKNGLSVMFDTFYYASKVLNNKKILIEEDSVIVQSIYINQLIKEKIVINGICALVDNNNHHEKNLKDKIVITQKSINSIVLKKYFPKAIVVLAAQEFEKFKELDNSTITLSLKGIKKNNLKECYNLIATYNKPQPNKKDIIITAHWDSKEGPGANDNASGISLLMELSKYFKNYQKQLPYNLKFVAFGAEEEGLIGSQSYICKYTENILNNCILNLNMDCVGGGKTPYIEMQQQASSRNPLGYKWLDITTLYDNQCTWYSSGYNILNNSSSDKIYPYWLKTDIETTMSKSNIEYFKGSCCSGSDHRSFGYLDVPIVYVAMVDLYEDELFHTPHDIPKNYFLNSLDIAFQITKNLLIEICNNAIVIEDKAVKNPYLRKSIDSSKKLIYG